VAAKELKHLTLSRVRAHNQIAGTASEFPASFVCASELCRCSGLGGKFGAGTTRGDFFVSHSRSVLLDRQTSEIPVGIGFLIRPFVRRFPNLRKQLQNRQTASMHIHA
jgi:hypothetical protein